MNTQEQYEGLMFIQKQLLEWAANQPEAHFKLYGSKSINEALQLCKKMKSSLAMQLLQEEAQLLDMYTCDSNSSLALSNIN